MQIKPFQAVYPRLEFVTSSDSFFGTVKREYPEYKQSGFFKKTAREGFYIYQIQTPRRKYTGLVCTADVEGYLNGNILLHENTLTSLEQVQLHLLFRRKAAVKPVLLSYPKVESIESFLQEYIRDKKPFLEIAFEAEEQQHSIWEVNDGEVIQKVQLLFEKNISKAYIADGHHRTSTAAMLYNKFKSKDPEKYRYFLTAFFSFSELEIFDYNRVVQGLHDHTPTMFMARLSQIFDIEVMAAAGKPTQKNEIVMFFNHEWYRMTWRKEVIAAFDNNQVTLDATLLNEKVLRDILGILDVRKDKRIKYVEGPKGLEAVREITLRSDNRIGFLLYPVTWTDFLTISNHGEVMPPKSTWFEPRMKNGIIVQDI